MLTDKRFPHEMFYSRPVPFYGPFRRFPVHKTLDLIGTVALYCNQ